MFKIFINQTVNSNWLLLATTYRGEVPVAATGVADEAVGESDAVRVIEERTEVAAGQRVKNACQLKKIYVAA